MLKNVILVLFLLTSNLLFGQLFGRENLKQDFNRVEESDSLRENYAIVYGKFKSKKQFIARDAENYTSDRFAHFIGLNLEKDGKRFSMKMEVKPINADIDGEHTFCYFFPKGKYYITAYTLAEEIESTWVPIILLNQPTSVYLSTSGSNYYSFEVDDNTINYVGTWDFTRNYNGTLNFPKNEINFLDDKEKLDLEMVEKFKKLNFDKAKIRIPN